MDLEELLNSLEFVLDEQVLSVKASSGYAVYEDQILLRDLISRADAACRFAKEGEGHKPIGWSAELAHDEVETLRRKCPQCLASTSLQVFQSKKKAAALCSCANCGLEFSPRADSEPGTGIASLKRD